MATKIVLEQKTSFAKYIPYIIILVLGVVLSLSYCNGKKLKQTNARYKGNFIELQRLYQDKEGKWTVEVSAKTVRISELEAMIDNGDSTVKSLLEKVKNMGIKIKNLESLGQSGIAVHDTILIPYYLEMPDTTDGKWHYTDGYFTVDLFSKKETGTKLVYEYKDTLTWAANVFFLEKWKFKNIFVWRDKYVKLNSQMGNPKAKIFYQTYYRISPKTKRLVE